MSTENPSHASPEDAPYANRESAALLPDLHLPIYMDGDPPTPEAWLVTSDFLATMTQYFTTEFESNSTVKGAWWAATAEDIRAELAHYNSWAQFDAETSGTPYVEVTLPHALAVSYRRLYALGEVGRELRREYPISIHLHEAIRTAALGEQEAAQAMAEQHSFPTPPLSPLFRHPVWELLPQASSS